MHTILQMRIYFIKIIIPIHSHNHDIPAMLSSSSKKSSWDITIHTSCDVESPNLNSSFLGDCLLSRSILAIPMISSLGKIMYYEFGIVPPLSCVSSDSPWWWVILSSSCGEVISLTSSSTIPNVGYFFSLIIS